MLFHGTKINPALILQNGYKNSRKGKYGKGVYMTDCSDFAAHYANPYVFVNEVLKSQNMRTVVHKDRGHPGYTYKTAEFPFAKHVRGVKRTLGEGEYKTDVEGRRYRNVATSADSIKEEFVADAELVVPRYLVRIKKIKRNGC